MTPTELETAARQRYNAVGDTFFSQANIFNCIWHAEMQLAMEARVIRNTYTASTVASQQAYAWPAQAISIKRITYDGAKLDPINMREDDAVTLINATTTATGTPVYYFLWERGIYLRPIPAAVGTLKIFTFDTPQEVTSSSDLSVPEKYHLDLLYFVLAEMALKDGNAQMSQLYRDLWETAKQRAKRTEAQSQRGDAPAHINDISTLATSGIGSV